MFCCSSNKQQTKKQPSLVPPTPPTKFMVRPQNYSEHPSTNITQPHLDKTANGINQDMQQFLLDHKNKTITEEQELIKKMIGLPDSNHMLDFKWAIRYTDYLGQKANHPGCIDNTDLNNKMKLKQNPLENQDYVLVSEAVWLFLTGVYGGGPTVRIDQSFDDEQSIKAHGSILIEYTDYRTLSKMQTKDIPAVGLINTRFYCYINSVLQCLMAITQLNYHVLNALPNANQPFLQNYHMLLRRISSAQPSSQVLAKEMIKLLDQHFCSNQMHDSQETLLFILGKFKDELNNKKYCKTPGVLSANEAYQEYCKNNQTYIDELFFGQMSSFIKCSHCNKDSVQHDPFFDISLPIDGKPTSQSLTLLDCMKTFFQHETIDDGWICDGCTKKNKKVKKHCKISYAPNVLILNLKRFRQYPQKMKIKESVLVNLDIDIRNYCLDNINSTKYKLSGMVLHQGSIDTGHYVALVDRKQQFYLFDDEEVHKIPKSYINKIDQAYILFYIRV